MDDLLDVNMEDWRPMMEPSDAKVVALQVLESELQTHRQLLGDMAREIADLAGRLKETRQEIELAEQQVDVLRFNEQHFDAERQHLEQQHAFLESQMLVLSHARALLRGESAMLDESMPSAEEDGAGKPRGEVDIEVEHEEGR